MEEQLESLFEFLHDNNSNVRQIALKNLLGYTVSTSQYQQLFKSNNMRPIIDLKNLCKDDTIIAHDAYKALVNLTSDEEIRNEMNDDKFLKYLMTTITNREAILADLACLNRNYNKEAEFHFLASVFANVSVIPQGRRDFFLTSASYDNIAPISKLIIFTEHSNIIRRGGVISCIKNCCFETDYHLDMLSEENINILPYILLPLCGPEEFDTDDMEGMPDDIQLLPLDKKRESDSNLRKTLLESLVLLTTTKQGRDILRQKKVYPVIRQMHLVVKDENIEEIIEKLVNMLMRDDEQSYDKINELQVDDYDDKIEEFRE
ncbi:eukaryotic protein [Rhizophagus clarus]|uniref:Protein HGH1 homolog n=1 Tax=Rhizophagus clarus TaxID=94130 RepID=A0A8H3LQ24_9GLOM|nr:eukaryotic protein [Rhizophagus clarus]